MLVKLSSVFIRIEIFRLYLILLQSSLSHPLTLPRKVSTKARQTMSFANTVRTPLGSAVSRLSHTVTKSNTKPVANLSRKFAIPVIRNNSPELQSFNAKIGAVSCLGTGYLIKTVIDDHLMLQIMSF